MSRYVPDNPSVVFGVDLIGGTWNPGNRPSAEVAEKVVAAFGAGVHWLCMQEMLDQEKAKRLIVAAGLDVRTEYQGSQARLAVVTNPDRLVKGEEFELLAHKRQPTIWKRGRTTAEAKFILGADYTDTVTGRTPQIASSHALHQQWNPLRAALVRQHVATITGWAQAPGGTKILGWDGNMVPTSRRMQPFRGVMAVSHWTLGAIPTMKSRPIDYVQIASKTSHFVAHWTVNMGGIGPRKRPDHRMYLTAIRGRMKPPPFIPCPETVCYPCSGVLGHEGPHIPRIEA